MRWLLIKIIIITAFSTFSFSKKPNKGTSWIRINYLGYQPNGVHDDYGD